MNKDLIDLLALKIPTSEKHSVGFLEIAGMAHYENVNSRIYAYFLSQESNPEIANCFLSALLQLIEEKYGKQINIDQYTVIAEDITNNNNRIDITLNDTENQSAVIIENKIYHYLHNDLEDYWKHFNYPDQSKIGVLLTLESHAIPEYAQDKFVNITHNEWIQRIQENGLPSKLPSKIYTYLNDFFNTIEQLTKTTNMNELAKFYFEHTKQVLTAKKTEEEAQCFINSQINQLAGMLNWDVYGKSYDWRNIWDAKNKLKTYYTIWYRPLLEGEMKVWIIIEMNGDDMKREHELDKHLEEHPQYKALKKKSHRTNHTIHYLGKEYTLTINEVEQFAETLKQKIDEDFADVMEVILAFNKKAKA